MPISSSTGTPGLTAAQRTTHIETDFKPVALAGTDTISAAFARQQILTYRLLTPEPSKPWACPDFSDTCCGDNLWF